MSQEKKKKEKDPHASWFRKLKSAIMGKHWHRKSIERGRHDRSGRK